MPPVLRNLLDQLGWRDEFAWPALGAVLLLLVLIILVRRMRKGRRAQPASLHGLPIDLAELGDEGPPRDGPQLEFYHLPMRLAAIVLAPLGRVGGLPAVDRVSGVLDQVVPGVARVIESQQPLLRLWPAQYSAQGFVAPFFATTANVAGQQGKGTPWCLVAGRFEADGQKWMAGLVLRSKENNNFGRVVVEREFQWLDILRTRDGQDAPPP